MMCAVDEHLSYGAHGWGTREPHGASSQPQGTAGVAKGAQQRGGAGDVAIVDLAADGIESLELLWRCLLEHLVDCGSEVAIRPHDDSWPIFRAHCLEWLQQDESSFLLAARMSSDGSAPWVGFALVRGDRDEEVWYTDERFAELQTLVVHPQWRRRGIGTALMDAVEQRLQMLGVTDLYIGVDSVNPGAQRFYERRGYTLGYHLLYGRPGGGPRMDRERERRKPMHGGGGRRPRGAQA